MDFGMTVLDKDVFAHLARTLLTKAYGGALTQNPELMARNERTCHER